MRRAVLIGFEYKKDKVLPGIIVDLYQVYFFLKRIGWSDSEIIVFTDIKKDYQTEVLKAAILEQTVDSHILSFIQDTKDRGQYKEFQSHSHYNNFSSLFTESDYTFVYYSGHAKDQNLILPNNSCISFDHFKSYLSISETFLIMDCCEGGIQLPFLLHEKLYRLNPDCSTFLSSKMICISSSLIHENSVTSISGSFFTRELITLLEKIKLTLLMSQMKKKTKIGNISVSHPNIYGVFPWMFKFPCLSISLNSHFIEISK